MTDSVDWVSHPPHYQSHPSGIETLQVTRLCSFSMGNAIKYCWRFSDKNGAEDLKKARFYLRDILATGQAHHPPAKAKNLLGQVIDADDNPLRQSLLTHILGGDLQAVIALIDQEVGE